jgi:hypothetical protein
MASIRIRQRRDVRRNEAGSRWRWVLDLDGFAAIL